MGLSGQERETQDHYFVNDGVEALAKFGNSSWDQVVCILTTSKAQKFKSYGWRDPRTLFHHGSLPFFSLAIVREGRRLSCDNYGGWQQ